MNKVRECARCGSTRVRTKTGRPLCEPCRALRRGGRPEGTNWREPIHEPVRTLANPYGLDPEGKLLVRSSTGLQGDPYYAPTRREQGVYSPS